MSGRDRWDVTSEPLRRGPIRRASGRDRWDAPPEPVRRGPIRRASGPSRPSAVSSRQTSLLANPSAYKRDAHDPDYVLLVTVVALTAIGILMVYAASAVPSYAASQNTSSSWRRRSWPGCSAFAAMAS